MAVSFPEVTYEDVIAHFEDDPEILGSQKYVEAKIGEAVDSLAARFGKRISARLQSGVLTERLFKAIVAAAVLRTVRNPEGYRTEQQGNYSYGLNAAVASGYLWFTADNMLNLLGEPQSPIGTAVIGFAGRH